jgi:hypothetical protein
MGSNKEEAKMTNPPKIGGGKMPKVQRQSSN